MKVIFGIQSSTFDVDIKSIQGVDYLFDDLKKNDPDFDETKVYSYSFKINNPAIRYDCNYNSVFDIFKIYLLDISIDCYISMTPDMFRKNFHIVD